MQMLAPPLLTRNPKLGPPAATHALTGSTMNFWLSFTLH